MNGSYPTEAIIRDALLRRAKRFCRLAGITPRVLGMSAINDPNFINKVEAGAGFTITTYQRVHTWLDQNDPAKFKRARAAS
jgi:hypothetical protein